MIANEHGFDGINAASLQSVCEDSGRIRRIKPPESGVQSIRLIRNSMWEGVAAGSECGVIDFVELRLGASLVRALQLKQLCGRHFVIDVSRKLSQLSVRGQISTLQNGFSVFTMFKRRRYIRATGTESRCNGCGHRRCRRFSG